MTIEKVYLCAVPQSFWDSNREFSRFAEDALQCERRIAKEINLEIEFGRYTICCQRLEQEVVATRAIQPIQKAIDFEAVLGTARFPAILLSHDYLNLLHLAPAIGRIGASFFTPQNLEEHIQAFLAWISSQNLSDNKTLRYRAQFLRLAQQHNCGLVEIQTAYHIGTEHEQESMISIPHLKTQQQFVEIPEFSKSDTIVESFVGVRKQSMVRNLRERILNSLRQGEPVAFGSDAQHDVITEVLNDLVFVPPHELPRPVMLRIMYVDGSEAEPFPLFCLTRKPALSISTTLRTALMSMRHPELDPEIDFCWFRNRDVSRTRTLSETDAFCVGQSLTQLHDLLDLNSTHLQIYHTGFEPAVIGFYRTVVKCLLNQNIRGRLLVTPYYFRGDAGYQQGQIWV